MKAASAYLVFLLSLSIAQASDFGGVYALIDKVVLQPSAENPQRVQIFGVFAIVAYGGSSYSPPQRGYLYFQLPTEKGLPDLARREWTDLKSIAGTGKVVSFGNRHAFPAIRVRKADEQTASPDVYGMALGVTRARSGTEYDPIKSLLEYVDREGRPK